MHKITKGLKKKKKGKKSKHKEEELFKPEELEAYRREHQQASDSGETTESTTLAENEEWKKFNALTAGIDTILKKTQGDLDRIKSTSFFQRVPPPSEVRQKEEKESALEAASTQKPEEDHTTFTPESAIVPVSESESEGEDEDDIFDTTYIDVIASGEVKLVHIPDSPKEEEEGDDPFDTSIAERAILGPSVDKRGKKLVPIGSAVEILTGRVQAPTCAPIKRPTARRHIEKENLLLQSFDENSNTTNEVTIKAEFPSENKVTLLDDDAPSELLNTPIDLSQSLHLKLVTTPTNPESEQVQEKITVQRAFDPVNENAGKDDEDDEFAQLAVESLTKKAVASATTSATCDIPATFEGQDSWSAFEEEKPENKIEELAADEDVDPFDTTFAENILPGKAELKIIENEILNGLEERLNFQSDTQHELLQKVSIQITNVTGQQETADRISEKDLNLIQPIHRDLLGGSNTDLSTLGDQPLKPKEAADQDYIEYCDPFDTSLVETAKLPGQTELKFLERELLGEIKRALSDEDENFNPRADESSNKQQSRKVSFDLPLEQQNLLEVGAKPAKPLTPYYIRENSIPEVEETVDPFDTSFVCEVAPGKAELKLIESELFQNQSDSLLDPNFDPRDEKQVAVAKVVQSIQEITNPDLKNSKPAGLSVTPPNLDLLVADNDVQTKVLTPATNKSDIETYSDPFDTSIASNILPGKTELKLLESEFINSAEVPSQVYNFPATVLQSHSTEKNLFEEEDSSNVNVKPLTPVLDQKVDSDSDILDDFDPFDTSIACNIGLGKTELKILESELI